MLVHGAVTEELFLAKEAMDNKVQGQNNVDLLFLT
jgi:hypothetical protein